MLNQTTQEDSVHLDSLFDAFHILHMTEDQNDVNESNTSFNDTDHDNEKCTNCLAVDSFIEDVNSGEIICNQCGFVSSEKHISNNAEWNNYNMGDTSQQRCEITNKTPELFHSDCMSTNISINWKTKHKAQSQNLFMWHRTLQMPSKDRSLLKVYNKIDQIANQHNIDEITTNHCKFIYMQVTKEKLFRGAVRESMIASCMYYAYVQQNIPRSVNEVAQIFNLTERQVNKTNKILSQLIWHNEKFKYIMSSSSQASDFVHRYCSNLNISAIHTEKCFTKCQDLSSHEALVSKDSSYITALAIYLVCQKYNLSITKEAICQACDLSTVTLNKLLKIIEKN